MQGGLAGKVAIVTGGAGGIGGATVALLRKNGVRVAAFDRNEAALRALAERDAEVLPLTVDVMDAAAVEAACARVEAHFGRLDILVNVAGGGTPKLIENMPVSDWDRVIALNLSGPFYCMKAVAPAMRRAGGGAIVTVSSLAAVQISFSSGVSYTAAKTGLLGLTRQVAFEFARDNIRVNAVLPGPIMTPQMDAKIPPEGRADIPRRVPLGRWLTPEEVASTILFFCSDASSACTGTHLIVDGGMHVGAPTDMDTYFAKRGGAP
jgi:NAD(P)-dependent dehydrogenase (short-subunit alcohol dehydrogenase family)